ncbi:MAG: acyl-CoA dehydrogenase family protein [Clostridiales Family XIII bacterium]|jgi:butyryl-CoA dehydrogenase|nr:acyl-CoA dehydrogenase family protein [Clostridiales Family XIII bacterium]
MEFGFSEKQLERQAYYKAFAEKEVAPLSLKMDEEETFDLGLVKKLHEAGVMNIPYGTEYGGQGSDYVDYALAVEEISRQDASTGITVSVHTSLACSCVDNFGTPEQKERFLRPMLEGGKTGCFGLTEPGAGSDAAGQQTVAVKDGDDYVINGSKIYTTNAEFADIFIVFVMTDKSLGTKGISAVVVEKGTPGLKVGKNIPRMGIRGASNCEVFYEDVRVPQANLLGKEGDGFKCAMKALDAGRIGVAAQALGIAQGALDLAIGYVKERQQFGKPIAAFQNTQFKLADLQTQIDAARLMVYRAASAKSNGEPYGPLAAKAKLFASRTAVDVTREAVQMFGGYGYSRKYGVERKYRDAKITEIYEGTSEIMKLVISGSMKLV